MRIVLAGRLIPVAVAALGFLSLSLWLAVDPAVEIEERAPGADRPPPEASRAGRPQETGGRLTTSDGVPADIPGTWPRFRGENFDAISEGTPLARKWGEEGPEVLWAIDVGEGHAGAAVFAGRVYILDYDRANESDALRCLSLADGKEIWRYSYPIKVKRNHGMSRTVSAVTEKYIVALGPKAHVTCLNPVTGELLWAKDLVREFGTKVPPWYAGQCPLIEGGRAILAPGGDALMMALDCATGEVVWRTPNPRGWAMTHSSIMPMEFKGRRTYVYCASGGVAGVSAEDGGILWETNAWRIKIANIPSPVAVEDGRIFFSGGYDAGSMMLRLKEEGGRIVPEVVSRLGPKVFGAPQHTPILFGGHIYGVRPDGQLVCLDLEGNVAWSSGTEHRFGLGPYTIADGVIYVMNDSGVLTMVEATPTGYHQFDQAKVLTGHDSWGPMAVVGGRLIARDLTRMVCLDVGER